MTLPELQALPPGSFSAEPPDTEADAAFRERWEGEGRVTAVLEPVDGPTDAPPFVYTAAEVLEAWRGAERRLR